MPLVFSFSTAIDEALDILTSLISFIQDNTLLVSLVFLSIVISVVFALVSRLRG